MNSNHSTLRIRIFHLLLPVLAMLPFASHGAPGTLATVPLFLSNSVKPNIMFTLDDSGSMTWTFMPDSVGNKGGNYNYYHTLACYKNSFYNKIYYNPNVSYTPPVDASGASYPNASFTAAPYDGYDSTDGGTVDLSSSFKADDFTPQSANSDYNGAADTAQAAYYYVYTGTGDPTTCQPDSDYTKVVVSSTSGPGGTDERQNFANWFSYYRTRILMMKTAVGKGFSVLNDGFRVGFSTINSATNNYTPVAAFDATQRATWYQRLYGIEPPPQGTPLRQALINDGEYYAGNNSNYADPVTASCQQNYTILSTDGYWASSYDNPNVGDWDDTVLTLPDPVAGLTLNNQWPRPYYEGSTKTKNTLADVAMDYWNTDLRPTMTDNVPTTPADPASWQHMTTYTIGLGASGTLTYPGDLAAITAGTKDWPNPGSGNNPETIDDLWHAAVNGHGQFLQATDPSGLSAGLEGLLANIVGRNGSAAAVSFNTATLGTNSAVYTALFDSGSWTGNLISYPLDPNTGDVLTPANWSASSILDNRDLASLPRVMLTYNGTSKSGVPFQWTDLTAAQQADLQTNSAGGTDSVAEGQARLNYIRGDRSNEGATGYYFRTRKHLLGDIVHSGPKYVGTPQVEWPDTSPFPTTTGSRFSDFRLAHTGRAGVVYVGTNDGMLHAFSATTGKEVLDYIPSSLFSTASGAGLHYLTDPTYTHRYYVDLTPIITPAYVKTTVGGTPAWHSILLGAERGGGRGLFALDVTNPSQFSESNAAKLVLWEFSSADDPDLGYTFSEPTIALMNNGRWAAIFSNGYNDTGSGHAQLFIVYLDGGLDGTWTIGPGNDYLKLDTGVGSAANPDGLSSPAVVDLNGDGTADRIYAGDLQGHMWAFDVSSSSDSKWNVAYKSGTTPEPLFTTASNQPITDKPEVALNPLVTKSSSNSPDLLVMFGTGQYLVNADKTTTDQQAMYGVWDSGTPNLTQSNLQEQTFQSGYASNVRVPTDTTVAYTANGSSQQFGWYFNLTDSGERLVTDPVLRGDYLYFNTWVPTTDPCSYGGYSWSMAVKYDNGGPPQPAAFDLNGDGIIDKQDLVTSTSTGFQSGAGGEKKSGLLSSPRFLSDSKYETSSNSTKVQKTTVQHLSNLNTGRLSWRELGR